jgi:hypothetical protein
MGNVQGVIGESEADLACTLPDYTFPIAHSPVSLSQETGANRTSTPFA